ncbi:MAG TPA: phosphodiester glycosidase family protein [Prolixibacteraceae bacterium]|nr:phosphodiester glycosidase family protein [Prolixibacteraceae bacterium]
MYKSLRTKPCFGRISFLTMLFLLIAFSGMAQNSWISEIPWTNLMDGLQYAELDAPEKSLVNDSKLTIMKVDARKFDFEFLTASEHDKHPRTAPDWAKEFDQNIIINAGMYSYNKTQSNKGYMKNYKHLNNPEKSTYYNAMLAMHPKDKLKLPFEIIDITCQDWTKAQHQYHSFCQGMRMISCNGEGMAFTKRPDQSCSMIVTATDTEGNLYIIFSRSPYTHRSMIGYLQGMPLNIRTTVYLEGGPEASLYVNTGDTVIAKYGSYVSNTCNNDDNDHFWEIPNVIALRKKR